MIMFAQVGLGLLANLVGQVGSKASSAHPQLLARGPQLHTPVRPNLHHVEEPVHHAHLALPHPPEGAAAALKQLQQENASERQALLEDTKQQILTKKADLFAEKHLETETTPEGKQKVVVDDEGRPVVKEGPETPPQREARETFEGEKRQEIEEKHVAQREDLVQTEKQDISAFLQENKPDLSNPAVQGELQKMILQSHKKALQLNRDQDAETLRADLYDDEQKAVADSGLKALHQLEDKHAREEDESPHAQQLLSHHEDIAEVLRQRREEVREQQQSELFLKGRPNFNRAPAQAETDVAQVLPPHLSNALYQLGIYTV